jgi:hypothetical protein
LQTLKPLVALLLVPVARCQTTEEDIERVEAIALWFANPHSRWLPCLPLKNSYVVVKTIQAVKID